MHISALHHIGYVVRTIGPVMSRLIDEGATVLIEPVDDPIQRVTVALLMVDGITPIELVAPIEGMSSPIESRLKRGGGMDHLCYSVDDVAGALGHEEGNGALVVCKPVFAVAFGKQVGFVQRRSGMVIEFVEK